MIRTVPPAAAHSHTGDTSIICAYISGMRILTIDASLNTGQLKLYRPPCRGGLEILCGKKFKHKQIFMSTVLRFGPNYQFKSPWQAQWNQANGIKSWKIRCASRSRGKYEGGQRRNMAKKEEELNAVEGAGQWGSYKLHVLCNKTAETEVLYMVTLNITAPLGYQTNSHTVTG